jgi:hypothetical protein
MRIHLEKPVIPKARQLEAITNGSFMKLLAEFTSDPTMVDIRRFISVTPDELRAHLQENSFSVRQVLARAQCHSTLHDRFCIERENKKYVLYWMDHGNKRFGEEYESVESAVADYLMKEHGLT